MNRLPFRFLLIIVLGAIGAFIPRSVLLAGNELPEFPFVRSFYLPSYNAGDGTGALAQLPDGRMAVGYEDGLILFDGREQQKISLETEVLSLASAGKQLFVGGFEEFGVLTADAEGRWTYHSLSAKLPARERSFGEVRQVLCTGLFVYFVTEDGLWRYTPAAQQLDKLAQARDILGAAIAGRKLLVNVEGKGLHVLKRDKLEAVSGGDALIGSRIQLFVSEEGKGCILFSSTGGAWRYDGTSLAAYPLAKGAELGKKRITQAAAIGPWLVLGTQASGAWVYERKTGELKTQLSTLNGLPENDILSVVSDGQNGIWFQHRRSLARWQPELPVEDYRPVPGLAGNVNAIRTVDNVLYLATDNGLYTLNRTVVTEQVSMPTVAQAAPQTQFTPSSASKPAAASAPAVASAPAPAGAGTSAASGDAEDAAEADITTSKSDSKTKRQKRREERLARKRKQEEEQAAREQASREALRASLMNEEAASRAREAEANQVQTSGGRPSANATPTVPKAAPPVNYLIIQSGNTQQRIETNYRKLTGINGRVLDLQVQGEVLFATALDGIYRMTNGVASKVSEATGRKLLPSSLNPYRMYLLQSDGVILLDWNGSSLTEVGQIHGNLGVWTSFAEDGAGNLYIGGRGGLLLAKSAARGRDSISATLHKPVNAVRVSVLRVGTQMFLQSGDSLYHLKSPDKAVSAPTLRPYLGRDGQQLPTADGCWTLHDNTLYQVHLDGASIKKVDTITTGRLFSEPLSYVAVSNDGSLWLGQSRFVAHVLKPSNSPMQSASVTHLLSLSYRTPDGEDVPLALDEAPALSYDRYGFTARFAAPEYDNPDRVRYQYRLADGQPWQDLTENRLPYTNQTFGTFELQMRLVSALGHASKPFVYSIEVSPPWYRTWTFFVILLALTIGGVFGFVEYRGRALKQKNAELELKVQARTAQIQQQIVELQDKNETITQQNVQIQLDKQEIQHKNDEILESIFYARRIQQAILPKQEQLSETFPHFFILYKPRDVVSGDFYWYNRVDNRVFFAAGDCTGHGVPGALMSMIGNTLLNQIVGQYGLSDPAKILEYLHIGVQTALQQTQGTGNDKVRDGMELVLCQLDVDTRQLLVASANRPFYVIENGELIEYRGDKVPIGGSAPPHQYQNLEVNVKTGQILYLCSDGYADQFGGPNQRKFQTKRFKELLLENSHKPLDEQSKIFDETIEDWRGPLSQVDDILVMGIRF
jgi:serine phosphatase RsbU (regulator of sigma subunit)/ligand-binding sensor domain-containing protein